MSDGSVDAAKPRVPAVARLTEPLSPDAELLVGIASEQFLASKLGLPPSVALVADLVEFSGGLLLALGRVTPWLWWSA